MQQGKCSLTWPTYSDHVKGMMKELMMNEDFSDVTLVTEDKKQINANISVLSACSPVFKDILKKEKSKNQIMYFRGIHYSEMESVIQFIYLGEATFHEERIDEFFAVAKSLEIKELCNAETKNELDDDEPSTSDQVQSEEFTEQTVISDNVLEEASQDKEGGIVSENRKYECKQCHKTYSGRQGLNRHNETVHQGVKYDCDQCDYQATQRCNLTIHVQSKHEGVKYSCDQCETQTRYRGDLTRHIQSMHGGVKYFCDQCDYQAKQHGHLKIHFKNKH